MCLAPTNALKELPHNGVADGLGEKLDKYRQIFHAMAGWHYVVNGSDVCTDEVLEELG